MFRFDYLINVTENGRGNYRVYETATFSCCELKLATFEETMHKIKCIVMQRMDFETTPLYNKIILEPATPKEVRNVTKRLRVAKT